MFSNEWSVTQPFVVFNEIKTFPLSRKREEKNSSDEFSPPPSTNLIYKISWSNFLVPFISAPPPPTKKSGPVVKAEYFPPRIWIISPYILCISTPPPPRTAFSYYVNVHVIVYIIRVSFVNFAPKTPCRRFEFAV